MVSSDLRLIKPIETPVQGSERPGSIVLIGSYPPRRCGIATFTRDVHESLVAACEGLDCEVFAMVDEDGPNAYPPEVSLTIATQRLSDYRTAAARITRTSPDVVFVQHEFGIYGGAAGEYLLQLLEAIDRPVVTLLHTVLDRPDRDQRFVFSRLIERSSHLIVMAEQGRTILRQAWNVRDGKIMVIPHGAPDRPLLPNGSFKEKVGFGGRDLLFSFGLLSPNKGLENAIRALPGIAAARPNVVYAIMGATHPHLIAREGERYRASLVELARELGVERHLHLVDEYADTARVIEFLQAADIFLSPYLNAAQVTSGTLSYAAALGVPIIATPYWHAEELLGGGAGRLVPFRDCAAIAREAIDLLEHPDKRWALREHLYAKARRTVWSCFAQSALSVLGRARPLRSSVVRTQTPPPHRPPALEGVQRLTDGCGILQHSIFDIPDRRHGYCIDDNARALLLMGRLPGTADSERRRLTRIYAAFVDHAWNRDRWRFRNFMSYERVWLEEAGSDDSNGRAFWSVAETLAQTTDPHLRNWAETLIRQILPHLAELVSPRTNAFMLLGLAALIEGPMDDEAVIEMARRKLAEIGSLLVTRETKGAPWFEPHLSYDNARLPEAMIRAGMALNEPDAVTSGLTALEWLCARQTSDVGLFVPVTTADLELPLDAHTLFDQQPVEAAATADACEAAFSATQDSKWARECERAFGWFFGGNILGVQIAQPGGDCFDGLTWRGPNRNMGAESVLSLQLATCARARIVSDGLETKRSAAESLS